MAGTSLWWVIPVIVQPVSKQNFDQHIYMRYRDCKYSIGGSRRRWRGSQISKYWEWPGEPTSSSQQASPPPNISANEIPRYTRVLLTQRFLSLQLSLLSRNWTQCKWNSTQLMLILKIMPFSQLQLSVLLLLRCSALQLIMQLRLALLCKILIIQNTDRFLHQSLIHQYNAMICES